MDMPNPTAAIDESTRVRQGARQDTSLDTLLELARDPSVTVRASLAMNPALPPEINALLAGDADARVRSIVGRKIASLTPTLAAPAQKQLRQDAIATLTTLVADAALRVRGTIAEAVKDMPDGPREIILRLANDPAIMVAEPVIRFSPMLTAEDLIAVIASGPPPHTLRAVASRPNIPGAVSDAVVHTADSAAIRALLSNKSAQIREATLDALAERAEQHPDWHEPFVERPYLPANTIRRLAEFVTGNLLTALASRRDIDPSLADELRQRLAQSVAAVGHTDLATLTPQAALLHAQTLGQAERLDNEAFLVAIRHNAVTAAKAMLAVKADVPMPVIENACALRSARAMLSLTWKAGLSLQIGVAMQVMLARVAPADLLKPGPGGRHPLSIEEMRSQLMALGVTAPKPAPWAPPKSPRRDA